MTAFELNVLTILMLGGLYTNADRDVEKPLQFGTFEQLTITHTLMTTDPKSTFLLTTTDRTLYDSQKLSSHAAAAATTTAMTRKRIFKRRQQDITHRELVMTTPSVPITTTITTATTRKKKSIKRPLKRLKTTRARGTTTRTTTQYNNATNHNPQIQTTIDLLPPINQFNLTHKVQTGISRSPSQTTPTTTTETTPTKTIERQNRSLQNETEVNNNIDENDVYSKNYQSLDQRLRFNKPKFQQRQGVIKSSHPVEQSMATLVDDKSIGHSNSNISHTSMRPAKAPRMITRMVSGHIQNSESRSKFQVSAVSMNSTVTVKPTHIYFRRKGRYPNELTTTAAPATPPTILTNEDLDDEAFLEEPEEDFDDILRLSAGSGQEYTAKTKKHKSTESKKTLSDQIRDGKYGLIENELFREAPKRPGVLTYLNNKEVPLDNDKNFGGLNEDDIWLAEDHLLVIKGGSLNDAETSEPWPAIDDYDAPERPIKLPTHPKIPPPFPVQLDENGPIQLLGNKKYQLIQPLTNNTTENQTNNAEALPEQLGYIYPAPYPLWLHHNESFLNSYLKNGAALPFPGLGPLPISRNNATNKLNASEPFDEDDPTLYYPPAYSFVYKSNYNNTVLPGPLVPGIVVPPPPQQFARLEKSEKIRTSSKFSQKSLPRQRIHATTTSSSTTTTTTSTTTTSTTTTTTTTTTPMPILIQHVAKINQNPTKVITVTPITLTNVNKSSSTTSTAIPAIVTKKPYKPIKPVPVPVAVPIPVYTFENFATARPNSILNFVPTTSTPDIDTYTKSRPTYFEYFEAKRTPATTNIDETNTIKPQIELFKERNNENYYPPSARTVYVPEDVVYITPKPQILPLYKHWSDETYERQLQQLPPARQTIRNYQNQHLRENIIPRTPKTKVIYEYYFDATKNLQTPPEFDKEPFKPMVTYSPPLLVDDEYSFRAVVYDKNSKQKSTQKMSNNNNDYQNSQRTILLPQKKIPTADIIHRQPHFIEIPMPIAGNYAYNPEARNIMRQRVNLRRPHVAHNTQMRKLVNYQAQPVWSIDNVTFAQFLTNTPTIVNINSEYGNPYLRSNYANDKRHGLAPPPYSHQSQYYVPPQRVQQPPPNMQHSSQPYLTLNGEVLVNYRKPLTPINTAVGGENATPPRRQWSKSY